MRKKKVGHILGSAARTLLAAVFIFSGFVKAVDPLGTTYKIEDYLTAFGSFFAVFVPAAEPLAWVLIVFEFLLGISLLFNIKTQATSWLALLLMCFMTPLTLYIAIKNPVSDCGCFGDALVLSNWATFAKNVVLLALVVLLLLTKKYIPQTFTGGAEAGIFTVFAALLIAMMLYCRLRLPLIDFRPYKVGNNIIELMEIPDGAAPDVYETTFVYEKDGVEQEFTLQNYPKNDSSWVFVRQNTKLLQKGYEPPVHDFAISNEDFEDITDDLLYSEDTVTMVVMYDLKKTSRKQAAKLNRLCEESQAAGHVFVAVTGSGTDEIETFAEETQAHYPFCTADGTMLKTIVRANPGVVVLSGGTVVKKYNLRGK